MTKVTIRWEADDGYAGGSAPHWLDVDLEDIDIDVETFNSMTEEERITAFQEYIEDDFRDKVSWIVNEIELSPSHQ